MLKDVQADRVIYLYSSLTPFPNKSMNCVEDWVIVVRRVSASLAFPAMNPSSMHQTWHRAYADQYNVHERAPRPQNERVLRFRSGRIGSLIQTIETGLLEAGREEGWNSMPSRCPFSIRT